MRELALAGALAFAAPASAAADGEAVRECFMQASAKFQVPTTVMATIALTEGCWVGFEGRNDNGSVDRGLMCINSIHDRRLAKIGITPAHLRDDACTSIAVATLFLREHFDRARALAPVAPAEAAGAALARLWADAIGRYHSATPRLKARYQGRAHGHLERLLAQSQASP